MGAAETPLEQAERHVREGEARIKRQELLITSLERGGHIRLLVDARDLLARMHEFQRIGLEHVRWERAKLMPGG